MGEKVDISKFRWKVGLVVAVVVVAILIYIQISDTEPRLSDAENRARSFIQALEDGRWGQVYDVFTEIFVANELNGRSRKQYIEGGKEIFKGKDHPAPGVEIIELEGNLKTEKIKHFDWVKIFSGREGAWEDYTWEEYTMAVVKVVVDVDGSYLDPKVQSATTRETYRFKFVWNDFSSSWEIIGIETIRSVKLNKSGPPKSGTLKQILKEGVKYVYVTESGPPKPGTLERILKEAAKYVYVTKPGTLERKVEEIVINEIGESATTISLSRGAPSVHSPKTVMDINVTKQQDGMYLVTVKYRVNREASKGSILFDLKYFIRELYDQLDEIGEYLVLPHMALEDKHGNKSVEPIGKFALERSAVEKAFPWKFVEVLKSEGTYEWLVGEHIFLNK